MTGPSLQVVISDRHAMHRPRGRQHLERPSRVVHLKRGLRRFDVRWVPSKHFANRHVAAVHDQALLTFLRNLSSRTEPSLQVTPEVFPRRHPGRLPQTIEDRLGYFCSDTFTPVTHGTYSAARSAVDAALTGASLVATNSRCAYVLCRPPGHHAEKGSFGGYCYLNNAAIAAHFLSGLGRVAMLDLDYHHGNGAQDIFWSRDDVLTVSIHGHPDTAYPHFCGFADEVGAGPGRGHNANFPLKAPVHDERYLSNLARALSIVRRFEPSFLVVPLGLDLLQGDPSGAFSISLSGLRRISEMVSELRLSTLVIQEGGYVAANLRDGIGAFLSPLAEALATS